MVKFDFGDAFSAGISLAMGLTMTQHMSQTMKSPKIKQAIVCSKYCYKNPVENKFCDECGKALYPPSPIQCPRCSNFVPLNNYCGRCGYLLRKKKKK